MNAWMILADSASPHQDGTISMLRAGINRVWAASEPISLKATLVARVDAEPSEKGSHEFSIVCVDEDGKDKLPPLKGTFQVPQGGGNSNFLLGLPTQLPNFGLYSFRLVIDRREHASLRLKAERIEAKNARDKE